jgi:uncharacterized protein with HEPN domain
MERSVRPALRAVLEAIDGIQNATLGKSVADYSSDWLLRHAIQRGIEIVSEAARRIPADLQATQPNVPWPEIMGIGNILRHEYHRISDNIIWNVVRDHLPPLRKAVSAMDAELREENE